MPFIVLINKYNGGFYGRVSSIHNVSDNRRGHTGKNVRQTTGQPSCCPLMRDTLGNLRCTDKRISPVSVPKITDCVIVQLILSYVGITIGQWEKVTNLILQM